MIKAIVIFFAVIGILVTAIAAYWILESLYYEHKYKNQPSKKETDFDRGFREGQRMANL